MSMRSVCSRDTPQNADVVAFCPYEGCRDMLACGCYELVSDEQPARRIGRLMLLSATDESLDELCSVECSGVLDCAWFPPGSGGVQLLALATGHAMDGNGMAELYHLNASTGAEDTAPTLLSAGSMECDGAGVCMSLDWSPASASTPRLALCSTAGMLYIGELAPDGLRAAAAWQGHDLEGWAVAFDAHDVHTLFSGADDGILKRWDMRVAVNGERPVVTASNRRSHGAGVCCISPSKRHEHLVATGSYDGKARLWDARQMRAPVTELDCGGGVWRLKWHPHDPSLLLAACMHAGFAVLRASGGLADGEGSADNSGGAPTLESLATYEAHGMGQALGYGADWAWTGPAATPLLLGATCSFYDRALHTWVYG